ETGPAGASVFEVQAGASVDVADGIGIQGNTSKNWTLTNHGSVTGSTGVHYGAATPGGSTLHNYGMIIGTNAVPSGNNAAVLLRSGGLVHNHAGATFESQADGVYSAVASSTVINDGTIRSQVTGAYFVAGG